MDITIIRGSSKGCIVFYKSPDEFSDEPGPAWYIERSPTGMAGNVEESEMGHRKVVKLHTGSKFKFRTIKLDPSVDTFEMKVIERAETGKLQARYVTPCRRKVRVMMT